MISASREPQLSQNLALVERLRAVADRHDTIPGAVAIAWTLRNPAVDGAIVGFRAPDQVDPILVAASLELSERRHRSDRRRDAMSTIGFVGPRSDGQPDRRSPAGRRTTRCTGTNRTVSKAQPLIDSGMVWLGTPREVAAAADVTFSMVTDDDALRAVNEGPDGILAGLAPGKVYVDMSTVSPKASREISAEADQRGAQMLDAPVSGSIPQAESGTLAIMVGGDGEAFDVVEPLLRRARPDRHPRRPERPGPAHEARDQHQPRGADARLQRGACCWPSAAASTPEVAAEVMVSSSIGSPMLKARIPLLLDLPEHAWFDVELMHKDIRLARQAGDELHAPLPSTAAADEMLAKATELGYGHRDLAALHEVLGRMSAMSV